MRYLLKIFLLISLISFSFDSFSINSSKDSLICKPKIDTISKTEYYLYVDSMPEYPKGRNEMLLFFTTNFNYPHEINAEGKVFVETIIDTNGKMTEIKIKKGVQEYFDNETIRVLNLMPNWRPGKCNGKPVPVKIILPFSIDLNR